MYPIRLMERCTKAWWNRLSLFSRPVVLLFRLRKHSKCSSSCRLHSSARTAEASPSSWTRYDSFLSGKTLRPTVEMRGDSIGPQETPSVYRGLLPYYLTISALISLPIWMLLLLPQILMEQGWSPVLIGWIIGVYFAVHLSVQISAGQVSSRIGNIGTATLGSVIAIAGGILYVVALVVPYLFFPARILHGGGAALVFAGALFLLVQSVPNHLKGRMMGYFGLPGFVMLAVGPLLAAYLNEAVGSAVMLASVPACFVVVLLLLRRLPQPLDPEKRVRPSFAQVFRTNLPRLRGILGISFVFGLSLAVWQTFLASTVGQRIGPSAVS